VKILIPVLRAKEFLVFRFATGGQNIDRAAECRELRKDLVLAGSKNVSGSSRNL